MYSRKFIFNHKIFKKFEKHENLCYPPPLNFFQKFEFSKYVLSKVHLQPSNFVIYVFGVCIGFLGEDPQIPEGLFLEGGGVTPVKRIPQGLFWRFSK